MIPKNPIRLWRRAHMYGWLWILAAGCSGGSIALKDVDGTSTPDIDTDIDTDIDIDTDVTTDTDAPTDTDVPVETDEPPAQSSDCLQPFTACGGDLTGVWDLASYCVDGMSSAGTVVYPDYGCPGATLTTTVLLTGGFDFAQDGTYSLRTGSVGSFEYDIPGACLGGYSCAQIVAEVGADTCTPDGAGGCGCVGDIPDATSDESQTGTWVTVGSALILTDDVYGAADDVDYCVDGAVLRLNDPAEGVDLGLTR